MNASFGHYSSCCAAESLRLEGLLSRAARRRMRRQRKINFGKLINVRLKRKLGCRRVNSSACRFIWPPQDPRARILYNAAGLNHTEPQFQTLAHINTHHYIILIITTRQHTKHVYDASFWVKCVD